LKKPSSIRRLVLLPLALLFLPPAGAEAADTYEASWNGGYLTATANAEFTEATIEAVSVSFDQCGTEEGELTCTWEARAVLVSDPESRCNPGTPGRQVVWTSGEQSGNGTVSDGPTSFPLEGCRGQTLIFEVEEKKTYEEGVKPPWVLVSRTSIWGLFTFGYHPVEEEEQRIITASPPANPEYPHLQPNFVPRTFALGPDCRGVQLDSTRYVFAFGQMGCHKAGNLAQTRFRSGRAPRGYACQNLLREGVRCRRRHKPAKFFEWRLPSSRS
jgi:hypothetical protein